MTNQEKMDILMGIYNVLFQSKQANTDITKVGVITNMGKFPGRWFVGQSLRGFDVDINTGDKIVEIRCIEQNPNKTDNLGNLKKHANLARQGHKIMWIINRQGGWLGCLQDGIWVPSFDPATKPAAINMTETAGSPQPPAQSAYPEDVPEIPGQPSYGQHLADGIVPNDLPEVAGDVGIPEYVLQSISEMEEPPDWGDYD